MEFAIGSRLKELRKTKGMSISELAERSGVSTGLISQIERDLVVPSVVNLSLVGDHFPGVAIPALEGDPDQVQDVPPGGRR